MGSIGNQNSWAPYDSYRDCSQAICSIYCPQWCYIIFPPPPPFGPPDDDSGTNFSPLIIAVIGILASAFILVSYYTIISKYWRSRRDQNPSAELEANRDQVSRDQWQVASDGLDETLLKSIAVCKYKKGDGSVEGTECAVCLSEFQEDDSLRLMPKCNHAFHLPCIDTWLKSHSNCPLCRSTIASSNPQPIPAPSSQSSSTLNISSLEIHRQNDVILVVDDRERGHREEVSLGLVCNVSPKIPSQTNIGMQSSEVRHNMPEIGGEDVLQFRRSISLGSVPCQGHLLVADILQINEDDEDFQMELCQYPLGIGSSKRLRGEHSRTGDRSGQ